jgi:peptidoglycan/LPS O-acetylase OafA/YrhL
MMIAFNFPIAHVPGFGLTIFFVLSGFLITWLMVAEQELTGAIDMPAFYRRRALRIIPPFYALLLLLTAVTLAKGRPLAWGHAASAFLFYTDFYHAWLGDPSTIFSNTWYLSVTAQFYLLWPFAFRWLNRSPRLAVRRLAVIVLGFWVYRLVLVFGLRVPERYLFAAFDARVDALLVGCLLAFALRTGRAGPLPALARAPWQAMVTILVMLAIYSGMDVWGSPYRDTVVRAALPPLTAVLIYQLVAQSGSRLWSWLESAPMRWLGRVSFGLCLFHGISAAPLRRLLGGWPIAGQFVAVVAATAGVASVSYLLLERPFLRRGRAT